MLRFLVYPSQPEAKPNEQFNRWLKLTCGGEQERVDPSTQGLQVWVRKSVDETEKTVCGCEFRRLADTAGNLLAFFMSQIHAAVVGELISDKK